MTNIDACIHTLTFTCTQSTICFGCACIAVCLGAGDPDPSRSLLCVDTALGAACSGDRVLSGDGLLKNLITERRDRGETRRRSGGASM